MHGMDMLRKLFKLIWCIRILLERFDLMSILPSENLSEWRQIFFEQIFVHIVPVMEIEKFKHFQMMEIEKFKRFQMMVLEV